ILSSTGTSAPPAWGLASRSASVTSTSSVLIYAPPSFVGVRGEFDSDAGDRHGERRRRGVVDQRVVRLEDIKVGGEVARREVTGLVGGIQRRQGGGTRLGQLGVLAPRVERAAGRHEDQRGWLP